MRFFASHDSLSGPTRPFQPLERQHRYDCSGAPLARWGRPGTNPGQFWAPTGLAVDAAGNVYVADSCTNRVQKLSRQGTPFALPGS